MGQKEKLKEILKEEKFPLSIKEIATKYFGKPNNGSGITNNLRALCEEGCIIKHEGVPFTYSWTGNNVDISGLEQKNISGKMSNTESKDSNLIYPKRKTHSDKSVSIEELEIIIRDAKMPLSTKQIERICSNANISNKLSKMSNDERGFCKKVKIDKSTYFYWKNNRSSEACIEPKVEYSEGDHSEEYVIEILQRYKDYLSFWYMAKTGTAFDLKELEKQTGLVLDNKLSIDGRASFSNQLELKERLQTVLRDSIIRKEQNVIDWIIKKWGGITNADNAMIASVFFESNESDLLHNLIELGRVASWSKVLSFLNPKQYFVYDARVAFSLDFLFGYKKYPIPAPTNSELQRIGRDNGIRWRNPTYDEYSDYCNLIRRIHAELWNDEEYYKTEMLIFSLLTDESFRLIIPQNLHWRG